MFEWNTGHTSKLGMKVLHGVSMGPETWICTKIWHETSSMLSFFVHHFIMCETVFISFLWSFFFGMNTWSCGRRQWGFTLFLVYHWGRTWTFGALELSVKRGYSVEWHTKKHLEELESLCFFSDVYIIFILFLAMFCIKKTLLNGDGPCLLGFVLVLKILLLMVMVFFLLVLFWSTVLIMMALFILVMFWS